tara:strand:+ start:507 stop:647 length:141 start_codon:yes stop_codon:yes gene_type:complete
MFNLTRFFFLLTNLVYRIDVAVKKSKNGITNQGMPDAEKTAIDALN